MTKTALTWMETSVEFLSWRYQLGESNQGPAVMFGGPTALQGKEVF